MLIGERNSALTEARGTDDRKVRDFGLLMGLIASGAGGYLLWNGVPSFYWLFVVGGLLVVGGMFARGALRPLYEGWMKLASGLAWLNTRLVLGVFFYLIFTPIGLVLRLSGKDLLNTKLDRQLPTYWIRRNNVPFDTGRYRRLF